MKKFNKTFNLALLSILISSIQLSADELFYNHSRGISVSSINNTASNRKEALIVGVSNYAKDNQDLNGIDNDIAKMNQLFINLGFNVTILKDAESMNLLTKLTNYSDSLTSKDTFAFYYTGHGSHKIDENQDESDGQDETLVLSDGVINKHLIDDILYQKFNNIRARKLVFFDSCHSGTVFRSGGTTQVKAIKPEEVSQSFKMSRSRGISVGGESIDRGEFVVFSSSQDTEESLATPTGSLFTNAVTEVFSDNQSTTKSLNEIKEIVQNKVLNYAKKTDGIPHHPTINYSNASIGSRSLQSFIDKKSIPAPPINTPSSETTDNRLQNTFDKLIASQQIDRFPIDYQKTTYTTGSSVEFEIDTKQERGYLTLFYIDNSDITILYPNPFVNANKLQGKYRFPQDLANGQFELEAYKSCADCQEEKTTVYALLSSEPITNSQDIQTKGIKSFSKTSYESKNISRAVRIKVSSKSNSSFKPLLGKYEFVVK